MRVGIGYDAHRLNPERPLVLGGVTVPFSQGLLGHSDADVLTHAICDAILGALGLGDIGRHFPDSDPAYKDVSSLVLLEKTINMAQEAGYRVSNVDATIIAEKPKLKDYIPAMQENLARAMKSDPKSVNIKATTTEGLGWIGKGEGIAAMAVAALVESKNL